MKKIYAVNGSPRIHGNTKKLAEAFLKGAKSAGNVEVEMIDLCQLKFSGCKSCYACKLNNDKTYSKCNIIDEISPLLDKIIYSDGILFASPIYFGEVTSLMRAFIERLLFPFNSYEKDWKHIAPKRMNTAVIYDMNVTEEYFEKSGYLPILNYFERCIERIFTKPKGMYVFDTCQFEDYSKYRSENFDEEHKKRRRDIIFPQDCEKAYEMGRIMVSKNIF
ncbi:MAG: flavodoxin family protein [Eubacterium sp.]